MASAAAERTLVLVKPDGIQRRLLGEVIGRFERRGLKLVAGKLMQIDETLADAHYGEHRGKPFFADLVDYITSGPVLAMVWEGPGAIAVVRAMVGATDPQKAAPGTVRGDFALDIGHNIVHGSDSPDSARREVALFFGPAQLLSYPLVEEGWLS